MLGFVEQLLFDQTRDLTVSAENQYFCHVNSSLSLLSIGALAKIKTDSSGLLSVDHFEFARPQQEAVDAVLEVGLQVGGFLVTGNRVCR